MHLNREHVRTSSDPVPPAAVAPAGGGGRIDRPVAKAASYSGKAKVVGWHCRRAKVRSQFPARGLHAESAAGVTGDPRDRTSRSWHSSGSMRKQGAKDTEVAARRRGQALVRRANKFCVGAFQAG